MKLTERECMFWLASREWLGVRSFEKLMGYFHSAKNIYYGRNSNYEEIYGLSKKVRNHLQDMSEYREDDLLRAKEAFEKQGGKFVCRIDDNFPKRLRHIYDVPIGLFYYGELPDEHRPMIAIVGAREASGYGLEAAGYFSKKLAQAGIGIISGLARGIDGMAHQGAMNGTGKTWAVLGSGVDVCYPRENYPLYDAMKSSGGILSEYGWNTKPAAWHFPLRNRLISGLSDGIFVIEARKKSGSLITADMGLEQGKNIYALPGAFQASLSEGCHRLIQTGAKLVYRPEDIAEDYEKDKLAEFSETEKIKLSLDKTEYLVYASLSLGPKDVDTISRECGLSVIETVQILMNLELDGRIQSMGQNLYMLRL